MMIIYCGAGNYIFIKTDCSQCSTINTYILPSVKILEGILAPAYNFTSKD